MIRRLRGNCVNLHKLNWGSNCDESYVLGDENSSGLVTWWHKGKI